MAGGHATSVWRTTRRRRRRMRRRRRRRRAYFSFSALLLSPTRRTLTDTAADCNCTVLFAAAPLLFTTTFYSPPPPPPDNNAREPMSRADKTRTGARAFNDRGSRPGRRVAIGRGRERGARIQSLYYNSWATARQRLSRRPATAWV